jgi:hypothetical protein
MSPPCYLSLIYVRPTAFRSHVGHRSNAHQRDRFEYSPGTQFHQKEPKEFLFDSRQGQGMCLFSKSFWPALGPTQPPTYSVCTATLSLSLKRPKLLKLTDELRVAPYIRISRAIPALPPTTSSWCTQDSVTLPQVLQCSVVVLQLPWIQLGCFFRFRINFKILN